MNKQSFLETSVDARDVERALLWSMRAWVIGYTRRIKVDDRIGQMWSSLGVVEAAGCVDALMWALSNGVTRAVQINCTCNTETSADEQVLLRLVMQAPVHRDLQWLELLGMVTPGAAGAICDSGARLRLVLAAGGFNLSGSDRAAHTPRSVLPASIRHVVSGTHTIH
ncbi:hypothetical protein [Acidisphaera sp. L21]|uniref:hypothetical protein n=1 Tax=Acidisphaera sp. L21 TaxID=1641851 RepID=UPI00131D16E0|nr:hypothetical protein [Acidisphaera sp. L21]